MIQPVSYCPNCKTIMQMLLIEDEYIGISYCPMCKTIPKEMWDWVVKEIKKKERNNEL